jgi:hypothetical protein
LAALQAFLFAQEKYILVVSIQWIEDMVGPGVRLDTAAERKLSASSGIKTKSPNRIYLLPAGSRLIEFNERPKPNQYIFLYIYNLLLAIRNLHFFELICWLKSPLLLSMARR